MDEISDSGSEVDERVSRRWVLSCFVYLSYFF